MSALPTLTALRASTVSAPIGQSVTFIATVTDLSPGGATPNGGTVTFSDQGGAIGSGRLVNGVAEFTTSSLAAGTFKVSASYSGTTSFASSVTGTIQTIAGDGIAGYKGNNGLATAAELNGPSGMAYDSVGDLFFAEYNNNVVREVVKATGDIITVAGIGTAGYSGDGGLATSAQLNKPIDVAVDSAGDLFIADLNNNRIREVVKATGNIITVAGNGTAGFSGDNGLATAAKLNGPRGVVLDSAGNLFFADGTNNRIREVVKATGDIITVAGNGTAGYSGDNGPATAAELNLPYNIAIDSGGDLFIADLNNNRIREVVKATGDIITFAGNGTAGYSGDNGPATAAELNDSQGVYVDALGDVFIADQNNYRIREVVKATGDIITVAGDGTKGYSGAGGLATDAELFGGRVTVDSAGDVFINNFGSNVVSEFTPAVTVTIGPSSALSTITTLSVSTSLATIGESITFIATVTDLSAGGAVANGGTVIFSDQNGVIGSETLVNGVATLTISSLGAGTFTFTASYGGTTDFAASTTDTLETVVGDGIAGYEGDNGPATAAELNDPFGLAVDSAGDLFIADQFNDRVREVIKATGDIITVAGTGTAGYSGDNGPATAAELNDPNALALDSSGDLFISDGNNNRIREVVKASGNIITVAGNGTAGYSGDGGPARSAEINSPRSVAIDSSGDLFIADPFNNRIREVVKATGDIITVAGNGVAGYSGDDGPATAAEINSPRGVAVDSAGDLFIADASNNRIREVVKAAGNIITIAGDGIANYSGDGGPATAAELNADNAVVVDSQGDVFINDSGNDRIREVVKATGDIITFAGNGTVGYSGDGGPATAAELNFPSRIATDSAGDLFISDANNNVVREVTPGVTVTIGQIVVTTQVSSDITAGSGFRLVVTLEDSAGGTLTDFNGFVTITVGGSGFGTLGGTLTVSAVDGVATFTDLILTKAGIGETLLVSLNGLVVVTTNAFTVLPAQAEQLVIIEQSTLSVSAGGGFSLEVAVEDVYGNIETGNNGTLLTIAIGAGEGSILGKNSVATSGGIATFLDLIVDKSETLSFVFTFGTLVETISNDLVVTASTAAMLVVLIEPSPTTVAGHPFATQPVLYEEDQFGNIETGDNTTVVTASLASGIGPLQGTRTSVVSGGIARFANLADKTPETITIKFSAANLVNVISNAIVVHKSSTSGDFDGDGKSDIAIYDQTAATFYILDSAGGSRVQQFGNATHLNIPVIGDFDGDGKTDIAIYDQTNATFYILESGGGIVAQQFGNATHVNIPIAGDFDGDGKTDLAIYDQTASEFLVLKSGGGAIVQPFGNATHVNIPIAGDFDGDGKTDIAIYDQTAATFLVLKSGGGSIVQQLGNATHVNIPIAGDFDGDGKTDIAVYDQTGGYLFALESGGGTIALPFGNPGVVNVPIAGDFDGDGKTDIAIYDQTDAQFLIVDSAGGSLVQPFGNNKHKNMPI